MPRKKGKKSKGKKGKKKKTVSTDHREDPLRIAIANAQLWEGKLEYSQKAKVEYRECARKLLHENESLQGQVAQTERDTVDVITFLKSEDVKKEEKIAKLQEMIKDLKKTAKKEKQSLIDDYTEQVHNLQEIISEKGAEIKLMQSELKLVKEFRRKRAQMQKELEEIKETVFSSEKKHIDTITTMEQKFFTEKMRLQQEANKKIAELAEEAHTAAVSNLSETTKNVYKENVRLNEALEYHVNEGKQLTKVKEQLETENKELSDEKELNSLIVEEKISQGKKQQKQVKELSEKIVSLETALTRIVKEFEEEKKQLTQKSQRGAEQYKMEIARLQRTIELKNKEMNRVKKLAKNILDQRSTLEQFFLESLEYVKNEIVKTRAQYQRDAQAAYNRRMLAASAGQDQYPKIRTFHPTGASTNSVFADMQEAENWTGLSGQLDISELTWEQRERVLRLLFAKMNGYKEKRSGQEKQLVSASLVSSKTKPLPQLESGRDTVRSSEDPNLVTDNGAVFLTQANMDAAAVTHTT